jgi:hypothetical protein
VQDACLGCFFTLFFYVLAPWSARPVPVYTPACSGGNAQSRAVPAEDLDALLEQALALHAVTACMTTVQHMQINKMRVTSNAGPSTGRESRWGGIT